MKIIPQRELRNNIAQVLREVEAGQTLRVTVNGRPVADLVPVSPTRQVFVGRDDIARVLAHLSPDPSFARDVDSVVGETIGETEDLA
ncbi:MAG TPA: type II toxin-antitoxin system prevent-host-death family antitoxin [Chloroflexota bacterium]|nr:type II toxin-antitoxin system prevent-host-death family antitoxin [Chloroflexota bacterium]